MTPTDTALIVIDVQESIRHRPYFREEGVPAFQGKRHLDLTFSASP